MDWNQISITDQSWMTTLFLQQGFPISDYNFTHLFIWKNLYQMNYLLLEGYLIVKGVDPITQQAFIYMPVGSGNLEEIIKSVTKDFQNNGKELIFRAITPPHWVSMRESLNDVMETLQYELQRSEYEYLYEIEKISAYPGSALSRKRELCKAFENRYKWRFIPYENSHFEEVIALIEKWHAQNTSADDPFVKAEYQGILALLNNYESLNCKGYVLCVEGVVSGFIVAEALNQEILIVHYEKANRTMKGAYDLMKRELAKRFVGVYKWINLEEDMGIDGLRKAKMLYRPSELLEKGSLKITLQVEVGNDAESESKR